MGPSSGGLPVPSLLDCKLIYIDMFGLVPFAPLVEADPFAPFTLGEADLHAQLRATWHALRYHFRRAQSELPSPPIGLSSDASLLGCGLPDLFALGSC